MMKDNEGNWRTACNRQAPDTPLGDGRNLERGPSIDGESSTQNPGSRKSAVADSSTVWRSRFGRCLTRQFIVCYNLHAGHGQMLRVVGHALETGWDVLPYGFLSIKPRKLVIWVGIG